jgi:hypothetical protein
MQNRVRCAAAKPRVNAEKPRFFINTHEKYVLKKIFFFSKTHQINNGGFAYI